MTDIAVETNTFLPADRPWLLFEAVGHQQPSATDAGAIDFSTFTRETHYPDGFLPSGIVLARRDSDDRLVAYSASGTGGAGTAVGLLYNATKVPGDTRTARKVAVAYVDTFAVVSISRLPEGSGFDAAAAADLPLVQFRP